ncbi:MAG: lysophospholipid acyltransferase family protein [Candidatus Margulisiibacteriota bacterium]|nr:lysophospholipid acyltransferase family protein [Candidatus Margulisiibacteriota bacterium]
MIIIRFIHTILFYLIVAVSFSLGSITVAVCSFFSKSKTDAFQTAGRFWARFLMFFGGVKVTLEGMENIPKDKPVIIAANHQAAADILFVLAYLPINFRFVIKKELFKVPILGWYLRKSGYLSIDRRLVLSAYRIVEQIIEIIKAGESILIFPEGTRTRTGELGRFKRGSLLAALKSGAPIVPVAISGSFHIIPSGTWIINPCPVKFSVAPPIEIKSEADYNNKVKEVRNTIAEMLEK